MHLDDETTQRWLHGELDPAARLTTSTHLADCPSCRRRLTEAEQEDQWIRDRLEIVSHPVPEVSPTALPRRPRSSRSLRWAAGVLLTCTVAGAAYAVPGSPLPRWLGRVRTWLQAPAPAAPVAVAPRETTSGIAVPVEPRLIIRFTALQTVGVARVKVVDSGSAAVRVRNGTATFTTAPGSLTIGNPGSTADYDIDLPRSSPWVAIEVGERRLLLKRDTLVRALVSADSSGHYVLSLAEARDR
jgi:hypothetical protein